MAQSSEDCEQDSQLDRGFPDKTEYNSSIRYSTFRNVDSYENPAL